MKRFLSVMAAGTLVTAIVACDPGSGPASPELQPVVSAAPGGGGVTARAVGSGHVHAPGSSIRAFTISAVERADGRVSGQYQLKVGPLDALKELGVSPPVIRFHGTITCMTVDGSSAYIGATVDSSENAELVFGTSDFRGAAIELIDGGTGPDATDMISSVFVYTDASTTTPQDYCDDPAPGPVFPIDQGNITVQ